MNESTTIPASQTDSPHWNGMTMEELRKRRAVALLRREVGRVQMEHVVDGMRTRVNDNGIRALMFNDKTVGRLKTADYLLLGFKLTRTMAKLWRKRR